MTDVDAMVEDDLERRREEMYPAGAPEGWVREPEVEALMGLHLPPSAPMDERPVYEHWGYGPGSGPRGQEDSR